MTEIDISRSSVAAQSRRDGGAGGGSRPTIVQVARAAGVSRATAARVLAGSTTVDAAMAAAVDAAAKALGYEVNSAARALRGGRAGAIGLVVAFSEFDSLSGTFFTAVLKGAAAGLADGEVQSVLLAADTPDRDMVPRLLRSRALDGAIVILQHEITHLVADLAASSLPTAWIGMPRARLGPEAIVVDSDNHGGGVLAARALVDAGRRRLAMITGPADMEPARHRARGWRDELGRQGIDPGPSAQADFTLDGGAAAMARLLRRAPDLDGVFAASDLMATGAMRVLEAAGRGVPSDVSVIGFDDVMIALASDPPLTTVRQPLEEMGLLAAETLLAATRGEAVTRRHVLPTVLVRRETL